MKKCRVCTKRVTRQHYSFGSRVGVECLLHLSHVGNYNGVYVCLAKCRLQGGRHADSPFVWIVRPAWGKNQKLELVVVVVGRMEPTKKKEWYDKRN